MDLGLSTFCWHENISEINVTWFLTWSRWSKRKKECIQVFDQVITVSGLMFTFSAQRKSCTNKRAHHLSEHTWNTLLHHISSAKNLLSAFFSPKKTTFAPCESISAQPSKWMLGCAPDLWSLSPLLKLTWFHLGAQTPIWSNLKACTLSPTFSLGGFHLHWNLSGISWEGWGCVPNP